MRKAKAGKRGKATKAPTDWDAIRLEWDANQLDVKVIADHHGITPQAITNRASRYKWPQRNSKSETAVVVRRPSDVVGAHVSGAGIAVARVLELLTENRRYYALLRREYEALMGDLMTHREEALPNARKKLANMKVRADILAKLATVRARMEPLERRSFGIMDGDAPSEFDTLTTAEQEELAEMYLQWQARKDRRAGVAQ